MEYLSFKLSEYYLCGSRLDNNLGNAITIKIMRDEPLRLMTEESCSWSPER